MVAIVIVSHSLRLAQGIEELALQMSGGDVPLAIAAGIDDPQNPIGTDAIAIMSAIESVWSQDGVLVLMDMGSALLSTEMALELLSEEQRSAIYLLAAPVVEGAMSAVTSAAAGLSVTEIIAEVDLALCAKQQQLMPSPPAGDVMPAISPVNHSGEWQTFCWTICNPHGIHARPAASILKVSAQYSANIIVIKGDKRASTRSLNELAMLGVRCGDEIIFQAEGTDASDALKAIETLAKNHFGEAHLLASSEIPLTAPPWSAPLSMAQYQACQYKMVSLLVLLNGLPANDQKLRSAPSILRKKSCRESSLLSTLLFVNLPIKRQALKAIFLPPIK